MKILGIDSSGMTASVALVADDGLMAEFTINNKRTHSETLLPMIDKLMNMAEVQPSELTAIAIAAGPGSFTGLRIGAATAKGLALALDVPIVPVPTLEGLAYNLAGEKRLVVSVMDARRNEVYAGAYDVENNTSSQDSVDANNAPESADAADTDVDVLQNDVIRTMIPETALPVAELFDKLNELGREVIFVGDGIPVIKKNLEETGLNIPYSFASVQNERQRGASIAALGKLYFEEGRAINSDDFAPEYLRKSQAERVRDESQPAAE